MDKKFLSTYLLLSIEGGISTVINILLMLILSYFECYAFFFNDFCKDRIHFFTFDVFWGDIKSNVLEILCLFYINGGIEMFITLNNKNNTPAYRPIFDMIPATLGLIIAESTENQFFVIKFVIYCIILFAALVYNEIIILHCFDLDVNILYNMEKRGEQEFTNNINSMKFELNNNTVKPLLNEL